MKLLSARIYFDGKGDKSVEELLDDAGFNYDFDDGGRLMVYPNDVDDVIDILENAGYEADEV